ncbi:hypothetical protein CP533_3832 [Ophiocordyceps camponoti-saundersi (nom. inval.)]|nr:hypothetical protein CP533_3832 [Ophiocordyceps camponoti-saundersi (nom. inval.)]
MESCLRRTLEGIRDRSGDEAEDNGLSSRRASFHEDGDSSRCGRGIDAVTSPTRRLRSPCSKMTSPTKPSPPRKSTPQATTPRKPTRQTSSSSPKARPALAPLNANVQPSKRASEETEKAKKTKRLKREVEDEEKVAPETDVDSGRDSSPDVSSVFDTSVADASWATVATHEADAATEVLPRRLTREQMRERVEVLRLRLGLASYKVRTGQTALPLADLQPRPLRRGGGGGGSGVA